MKLLLRALGAAATLAPSWFYLSPLLFPASEDLAPLLLSASEDVCFNETSSTCTSSDVLSVVHTADRAAEVAVMANALANEERVWSIDGQLLPVYVGPVARPGSVAENLLRQDLAELLALKPDTPELMAALATRWLPQLNSTEAYTRFYELFHPIVDAPMDSVDHGDVGFGASRLSLRGFNLRAIRDEDDDPQDETLTAENVQKVCGPGTSMQALRADKKLFLVDLATIGQWGPEVAKVETDVGRVDKYLPSVVGYFCFHEQLLPLAIKLVDSGLTYTPFDDPAEWQLAKTALNAAEATFQQMQHFSESHTLSIPIRVELYRAFAEQHPVRALLMRHFALDFGLEQQAGVVLFNTSTPLDRTFGIGAAGCVRFLEHQRRSISLLDDVYSDVRQRGIQQLPHKYAAYGKLHAAAISRFVDGFLDVYYANDEAVATDVELQNWAKACAKIPHLHDFPPAFESKQSLASSLCRQAPRHERRGDVDDGGHAVQRRCSLEAATEPQGARRPRRDRPLQLPATARALPRHGLPERAVQPAAAGGDDARVRVSRRALR